MSVVCITLQGGMRVIVAGQLKQRNYETKEGEKRAVYEVDVDDVGPSLRNASAKVPPGPLRSGEGRFGSGGQRSSSGAGSRNEDPWASDSGGQSDEPPF